MVYSDTNFATRGPKKPPPANSAAAHPAAAAAVPAIPWTAASATSPRWRSPPAPDLPRPGRVGGWVGKSMKIPEMDGRHCGNNRYFSIPKQMSKKTPEYHKVGVQIRRFFMKLLESPQTSFRIPISPASLTVLIYKSTIGMCVIVKTYTIWIHDDPW